MWCVLRSTIVNSTKLIVRLQSSAKYRTMAALTSVADVDIDASGVFKYILIKVYAPEHDGTEPEKMVVRGYGDCEYHADIYERFSSTLPHDLDAECIGGGRIKHEPTKRHILVYGYSQGYGKADHTITVGLLRKKYANYDITHSDDGY